MQQRNMRTETARVQASKPATSENSAEGRARGKRYQTFGVVISYLLNNIEDGIGQLAIRQRVCLRVHSLCHRCVRHWLITTPES